MLDTQIAQLSSTDLDSLFEGTPNADTLIVGKEGGDGTDNKEINKDPLNTGDIPFFDDKLLEDETTKTPEELAAEAKAKEEADKALTDAEKAKLEAEAKVKEEADKLANAPEVNAVLKNTVDFLVKEGLWADFDGRDGLEITQEVYADLAAKQTQHAAYEIVNELIDSTGDYGKAIIQHIKAGGNPDEIIDLFKEQKSLEQIDTSTEQGKQAKIEKYYSEVLGWKTEKVAKVVKRLVEDNEVDSEFKDVEELYNKHYQEKLAETQKQVTAQQDEVKRKQAVFVNSIKSALDEDATLLPRDKQLIASSILDFKHQLDNGQKVNDFYVKFAEMQQDPKKYIKLVRFVMDAENYEKQLRTQEQSKAAKDVFNFIKGNETLKKTANSQININEDRTKKATGTNFSFALKQK